MPIPKKTLNRWSRHRSGTASKQTHTAIRDALDDYSGWTDKPKYDVFLQGSYKNDTNLSKDSDVDVVIQIQTRLDASLVSLTGRKLETEESHLRTYKEWQSARRQVLKALRSRFGSKAVNAARKTLKLAKGEFPASADVVITLQYEGGVALFLPDEHRWTVSYPSQHYERGLIKERSTRNRYKVTVRMLKAARNHLVQNKQLSAKTAPSYFIECMLFNVPNDRFVDDLADTYEGTLRYLSGISPVRFDSQSGKQRLFGPAKDQWSAESCKKYVRALKQLWDHWPEPA